jgi:hypothetical protein
MLTKVYGSAVFGVEASTITVEVNVDKGVGYHLVGLPDNALRESNFRIAAALQNNGYKIPGKKLILNMSPADLRKEGSAYDLTLAMGILVATGQIKEKIPLEGYIIMGELSLDGSLQPIRGALPISIKAKEECFKGFILPEINAKEAAIVEGIDVFGVKKGLSTKFPERVNNSALSESTILGMSIGMALTGKQTVAFIQFADFLPLAYNQIMTELSTMYWRTNGSWECPVIILAACGGYRPGLGPFHSQTSEATYAHIPGLDVYMPSTAGDAAGLLNAAILSKRPSV